MRYKMKLTFSIVLVCCCLITTAFTRKLHVSKAALKDLLSDNKDLYFRENDDQPDITEKDLPRNGELFEGDMLMDNDIRHFVLGHNDKRSAVALADEGQRKHWPGGIVPYTFDKQNILRKIKRQIFKAIKQFKYFTCVKFVPKKPDDKDYVEFTSKGNGCSSSVGRVGGKQTIHLAGGCSRIGTVMHEMMHALGIIHEQSRPDRNKYLDVRFDNIKRSLLHNFRKYSWYNTDNLDTPYNFWSVMHYSNYAFSKNGKRTLESKHDRNLKFGQRKRLSHSDVNQINRLYGCHDQDYNADYLHDDMTDDDVIRIKRDRDESSAEDY